MQTFDQHLLQHLHAGRITMDAAMRVATSPHDFKLMVAASAKVEDDGPEATVTSPAPEPVHEPVRETVSVAAPEREPVAPPSYEPPPAPPVHDSTPTSPPPSAPPPGLNF